MAAVAPVLKVLLVGDVAVGKSCIIERFVHKRYSGRHYATIGVAIDAAELTVDGQKYKLHVMDTSGQDRFRAVTQSYYKSAQAIVLVYDITSQTSFQSLGAWITSIKQFADQACVLIIAASKSDLADQRTVDQEEVKRVINKDYAGSIPFIETSSKTGFNVNELFELVVRQYSTNTKSKPVSKSSSTNVAPSQREKCTVS
eukprot:TRINITY_DN12426_c0_g1_i1.p1 TRINITY_DN12426_c0_g1~~TRINITY_DN12426_c0_g1_i1.p1  ORF type:complete len:200 (-),score=27.26 TRINITY_DN12426_c0_g1_i1:62-661(-)